MKSIIDQYGWPGRGLVGSMGAQSAWLLVQHSIHDHEFQKRCLQLLEEAVNSGNAQRAHLAYLRDRVRVSESLPQIYGTQFDEAMQLLPIEKVAEVDKRRQEVGLNSLKEYVEQVREYNSWERNALGTAIKRPPAG